jgi:hypothetical protein
VTRGFTGAARRRRGPPAGAPFGVLPGRPAGEALIVDEPGGPLAKDLARNPKRVRRYGDGCGYLC